jgi:hypothetical protein
MPTTALFDFHDFRSCLRARKKQRNKGTTIVEQHGKPRRATKYSEEAIGRLFGETSATKLQTKRPVPNVAFGDKAK